MTNINIYIRKRPLPNNVEDIVTLRNNKIFVKNKKNNNISYNEYKCKYLIQQDKNNEYCYKNYVELHSFIEGIYKNYLIFTYGQTGSGKTHTITGNSKERGLLQFTIQSVLQKADINKIEMSAIEIYNNKIYDLQHNKRELQIYNYCNIQSKIIQIHDYNYFHRQMIHIDNMKKRGKTAINNNSSRSHIIYTFYIRYKNRNKTIIFIDLAGNERGKYSLANNKQEFIEYSYINQSLFALKECIRCNKKNYKHIPYRRSKLTMVLQHYFNISTKIILFSTIHPRSEYYYDITDTINYTLSFITNNICKKKELMPIDESDSDKDNILKEYFNYIDNFYNLIHEDQILYKKSKNQKTDIGNGLYKNIIQLFNKKKDFLNKWENKLKYLE